MNIAHITHVGSIHRRRITDIAPATTRVSCAIFGKSHSIQRSKIVELRCPFTIIEKAFILFLFDYWKVYFLHIPISRDPVCGNLDGNHCNGTHISKHWIFQVHHEWKMIVILKFLFFSCLWKIDDQSFKKQY